MAKSTVTTPSADSPVETTVATTVATEVTVDLGSVEKRLALVEAKLDELAKALDNLKVAAPADHSGIAGALAALEARVSNYVGRGR
jgi:hypothetical protein